VAPLLANDFTVVAADLRGYGDSSKPPTTADHAPYSKRAMARDQVEVMRQLGFEQFSVAGHDRGGRCAYRLALDHPERVRKLAVLDIIPTGEAFRRADMRFGLGYWHWFFLAQPEPLPEQLIQANPEAFYFRGGREADRGANRRMSCPVLALWAARGSLQSWYDVLAIWREWTSGEVSGRALESGHYLAEEVPEETAAELRAFFT
jgi:haloacetate dehalogenase